jgi:4-amino-4-deoxy-L-arabinose transferase-like glycosyltransferase
MSEVSFPSDIKNCAQNAEYGVSMSTLETEKAPTQTTEASPKLAWKPVSLVAAAVAIPLLLTLWRYGYDGDELYFIAAGRHLDWGFADQPPFVPLLAWLIDSVFPGSVYALRLPSALVIVAGVFLVAQLAREMGGERRAQVIAAATYALAFTSFGNLLLTDSFSAVAWLVVTIFVVRWVRRQDDKALLWAGVATAAALQIKFLIPVLWVALVIGVLISGPRDMLRRPLLWAGAAIAFVTTLPGLIWQWTNDWPQLKHSEIVRLQMEIGAGGRGMFLQNAFLMTGSIVGMILFGYGLWMLLRSPQLRDFRFLGWTTLGVIAIFLIAGGRFTYVAGIFPMVFAAAAVQLQVGRPRRWWRWSVTWPVFALCVVLALPSLSLLPASKVAEVGARVSAGEQISEDDFVGQLAMGGADWTQQLTWPTFVDNVEKAYDLLPPDIQQDLVILTTEFQTAGALEVLGPERGLPEHVYSYDTGFGYMHVPPDDAASYLVVGENETILENFEEVQPLGVVEGNAGERTGQPITLCVGPRKAMSELWPQLL